MSRDDLESEVAATLCDEDSHLLFGGPDVPPSVVKLALVLVVVFSVQVVALQFPAFVVSTQYADNVADYVRSFCSVLGVATTVGASFALVRKSAAASLKTALYLRYFGIICELPLFTLSHGFAILALLGVIDIVITIATLIALQMALRLSSRVSNPATMTLLRYASAEFYTWKRCQASAVVAMCMADEAAANGLPETVEERRYLIDRATLLRGTELRQAILDGTIAPTHTFVSNRIVPAPPSPQAPLPERKESVVLPHVVRSESSPSAGRNDGDLMVSDVSSRGGSGVSLRADPAAESRPLSVGEGAPTLPADLVAQLGAVARWHAISKMRNDFYGHAQRSLIIIVLTMSFLSLMTAGNIGYEFYKIFAHQPPLLSDALVNKYNSPANIRSYMPSRTHNAYKVHVVVVDGLRDDLTMPGASVIGDFLNNDTIAVDGAKFTALAQLPSFSVPNWMSILTGTPPETSGVTGNLLNAETAYDHIFRAASRFDVHAGMTGTPWWKDLVFSTLPLLDGDGTVAADFVPDGTPKYPQLTSNPADERRLSVALRGISRSRVTLPFGPSDLDATSLYDLFLTHFSDVDKQGHEYGIDKKWNKYDSYIGAVKNKTDALRQIFAAVDSKTVVVVTSDHGHVHRGGHGGSSKELRSTPLFFYLKGSGLRARLVAAEHYKPDVFPRVGRSYRNLDISATVCALLGVAAPRQTWGIFVEEVVRALLPPHLVDLYFFDNFMALRASAQAYAEMLSEYLLFKDYRSDGTLLSASLAATSMLSNATRRPEYYAAESRKLLDKLEEMRDARALFVFVRNLIGSLVFIPLGISAVYHIFGTETGLVFGALTTPEARGYTLYRRAAWVSFFTVAIYMATSIGAFLIGYFFVTGYTVWDSTLAHTPSVAATLLNRTIAVPTVIFILLTKLYLIPFIQWSVLSIVSDIRAKRAVSPLVLLGWLKAIISDIFTVLVTTRSYRAAEYASVHLYLNFLAMWTALVTLVVLFLLFPFTFAVPVVFSNSHVTEGNLEYRFRMLTILMMLLPLQVGVIILLVIRPSFDAQSIPLWDRVLQQCVLEAHEDLLAFASPEQRAAEAAKQSGGPSAGALANRGLALLADPELRVHPTDGDSVEIFPLPTW